jgi:hypothetical protein
MKTFYDIASMPEQIQHQQYIRLKDIWYDGQRKLLGAVNFISSLTSSNGEYFNFTRPVSMPDGSDAEFYDSIRLELPYAVLNRLPQMLADFAIVATALANHSLELDRPIPPTTETEK